MRETGSACAILSAVRNYFPGVRGIVGDLFLPRDVGGSGRRVPTATHCVGAKGGKMDFARRRWILILFLSAALSGGTHLAAQVPRFAYVANANDDTVSLYTINDCTGQLQPNGYIIL